MNKLLQRFHDIFRYDPWLGVLWWKPTSQCPSESIAGGMGKSKYSQVKLDGIQYQVHRICFAMYHGCFPKLIDHENRDKRDNRILNLRSVTSSESNLNRSNGITKRSGINGISWSSRHQVWFVFKHVNNKRIYIGRHKDLEGAEGILISHKQIEI